MTFLCSSMTKINSTCIMAESENTGTLEWMRPDRVMRLHRMKQIKCALQARMNKTLSNATNTKKSESCDKFNFGVPQRLSPKNARILLQLMKHARNRRTMYRLVWRSAVTTPCSNCSILTQREKHTVESPVDSSLTFANVLSKLESTAYTTDVNVPKGEKYYIPIDWTLKTKMMFVSPKPSPWNGKLKTSEEALGTTGFV